MRVELGPPKLLESGRMGRQVALNRSDKPVFVDNQGKLTCHHGERAICIQEWLAKERADESFVRPSVCDCQNIDGLLTDYKLADTDKCVCPASMRDFYQLLGALDAEQKVLNTRPQRKALTTPEGELWMQPSGTLVCTHGNTRKMLSRFAAGHAPSFKRKSLTPCKCTLRIPRRRGSVFAVLRASGQHEASDEVE